MADCESLSTCPFFNNRMANMPVTAEITKNKYCRMNFDECARYKVRAALGKEYVPPDLLPHRNDKAEEIIAQQRNAK